MKAKPFTPAVERVLALAKLEALKTKSFVDLNHILIGMLLEGDNYASLTLTQAGFSLDGLRNHPENPLNQCPVQANT